MARWPSAWTQSSVSSWLQTLSLSEGASLARATTTLQNESHISTLSLNAQKKSLSVLDAVLLFLRAHYAWAFDGRLASWNMVRFTILCGLITAIGTWRRRKRRTQNSETSSSDECIRGGHNGLVQSRRGFDNANQRSLSSEPCSRALIRRKRWLIAGGCLQMQKLLIQAY